MNCQKKIQQLNETVSVNLLVGKLNRVVICYVWPQSDAFPKRPLTQQQAAIVLGGVVFGEVPFCLTVANKRQKWRGEEGEAMLEKAFVILCFTPLQTVAKGNENVALLFVL